ncbi:hypothetical protein [Agromyces larvae]|uniref:Uncharacterized protein n=1 Tax=Agromyces larvae TaxID=2929802 RepID=A0ABY4C346_9MICO|nr:hypothetical protein [Agromyces larvae]UOE45891.1 hypothetical protein MTO99_09170 [Agromyces larvae]
MSAQIWFGTREHMQYVPAWSPGAVYDRAGSIESADYLNGGVGVRRSLGSHRTYDLTWPNQRRADLRKITDYADGLFGDGLLYWSDPAWMDTNALPARWATPWVTTKGVPPLLLDARPVRITNPDPGHGYPTFGARYTKRAASVSDSIFIPIPPGREAWIGVHGEENAADVVGVRRHQRTVPTGSVVKPAVLGVNTPERVNTVIEGGEQAWVEIFFDLDVLDVGDSFDLYGLVVQVLPSLATPGGGDFISGQGHSGCEWTKLPGETVMMIHRMGEAVFTSATLAETGAWL